jgi:hypothetical protein
MIVQKEKISGLIADKINELFQIFEPALIFKEYFSKG